MNKGREDECRTVVNELIKKLREMPEDALNGASGAWRRASDEGSPMMVAREAA